MERKLKEVARKAKAKAATNFEALMQKALRQSGVPSRAEFTALKKRLAKLEKKAVIMK